MGKILESIDELISKIMGFSKQEVIPDSIKKVGNEILLIKNTDSFKRHIRTEKIDAFLSENLKTMSENTRKKLGVSMGKLLAKNLVISFEPISIKNEEQPS